MAYVFVDKILECEPGQRVVATKALAYNEEFFRDHFPGFPVLPGAMILEGLVQAVRHCLSGVAGGHDRWILDEVTRMRFNRFAQPGDVLQIEATHDGAEEGRIWFRGAAAIDGENVGRLRFAVRETGSA